MKNESLSKTMFASVQWMLFMLMGSIVIPVSVASTYGLQGVEITYFVSRALFVLGIAGILQVTIGHRLPIQEGPAGVWWGVFILYATLGIEMFGSADNTLRVLSFCFIVSGIIFIALALLGLIDKIAKFFTPTVMGAYLVLLVLQLSGSFFKGMAGVSGASPINPLMLLLSLITVACAFIFAKIKVVSRYATMCSIVVGWVLFIIFGLAQPILPSESIVALPKLAPFGMPIIDASMALNAVFLTLLLLSNLLASISAMQIVFKNMNEEIPENAMTRAGVASGIIHILAGAFGALGSVPISGSAAFVSSTKNTSRKSFIIGNVLIILISLSPVITSFFASLPVAVGYAVLVPTFGFGTLGIALNQLDRAENKQARNMAVGVSWFIGIAIMFFPATAFAGLNPLIRTILSNGLIVGAVLAVAVEQFILSRERKASTPN